MNRQAMHVIVSVLLIFGLQMQCEIWCVTETVAEPAATTPPCHEQAPAESEHADECDHPKVLDDASLITVSKGVPSTVHTALQSLAAKLPVLHATLVPALFTSIETSHPVVRVLVLRI